MWQWLSFSKSYMQRNTMTRQRHRVAPSLRLFSIYRSLWEYRANDLREFLRISEGGLASKFEDWGDWYEERTKGLSDEQRSEFIDDYYDDLAMVRDTAPNLFRHAAFVMIVGFFEATVADICRLLHRTKKVTHAPRQKLYLDASSEYLTAKAGLPALLFGGPWDRCKQAEWLRDAIIHNNGRLPAHADGKLGDAVEAARGFVEGSAHISLSNHGDILIDAGFCEDVLELHEKMVRRLLKMVERAFFVECARHDEVQNDT